MYTDRYSYNYKDAPSRSRGHPEPSSGTEPVDVRVSDRRPGQRGGGVKYWSNKSMKERGKEL